MANYSDIIIFSLFGSLFSLAGGILLLSRKKTAVMLAAYATPFAAGALLAAVFFDLLPESITKSTVDKAMASTLIGLLIFFLMERFLRWFHHHHEHKDTADIAPTSLVIVGDTIHNALDGVIIAAAFLVDVPTGIITTIAVAAHEIPQEIGDFGLLLAKKMSRAKVLIVNITSALATVVMALVTFAIGSAEKLPLGIMLGLSAGFLLYIAASDIIPTVHQESSKSKIYDIKPFLLIFGVIFVGILIIFAKKYGA
jgi:zinc and cadmium transporter